MHAYGIGLDWIGLYCVVLYCIVLTGLVVVKVKVCMHMVLDWIGLYCVVLYCIDRSGKRDLVLCLRQRVCWPWTQPGNT